VDILTVKSLVRKLPMGMPDTQYYFCDTSDCEVVYFALDAEAPRFRREDLMVDIWEEIRGTGISTVAERIAAEVEAGRCACEVKNPSGKCCLGEVTRAARDGLNQKGESKL
jgi:hypothetical protein